MFRSHPAVWGLLIFVAAYQGQSIQAQFSGSGPAKHVPAIAEKTCGQFARIPEGAVSKGSFTVWTEPNDPKPGEKYIILIEIKNLKDMEKFPRCDLSGSIIGTDGYKDYFGGPNEPGFLPVKNKAVRFEALVVPGAAQLVKDVIQIKSKLLDEEQQLELKF